MDTTSWWDLQAQFGSICSTDFWNNCLAHELEINTLQFGSSDVLTFFQVLSNCRRDTLYLGRYWRVSVVEQCLAWGFSNRTHGMCKIWNVNYKQNLLFCLWCRSVLIHVVPRDKSQLNFFGDGTEALAFIHVGMLLGTKVVSQLCLTELAQTSTVCFFPKQVLLWGLLYGKEGLHTAGLRLHISLLTSAIVRVWVSNKALYALLVSRRV